MTTPDAKAREIAESIMARRKWLFIDDGEELTEEIATALRECRDEAYEEAAKDFEKSKTYLGSGSVASALRAKKSGAPCDHRSVNRFTGICPHCGVTLKSGKYP